MRTLQERIAAHLAQMRHDNPGRVGMPEGFSSDEIELRATWVYQHLGNTAQATVLH